MVPADQVKLQDYIKTSMFNIDINVLGLRQLESFGLLPIKKPFIKFNVRSLLPPEKANAVSNIKTDPKETGPNPNLNTIISFSTELPLEKIYSPKLACEVFDYICKGLN